MIGVLINFVGYEEVCGIVIYCNVCLVILCSVFVGMFFVCWVFVGDDCFDVLVCDMLVV